jgi:uncharacterized membrane protein
LQYEWPIHIIVDANKWSVDMADTAIAGWDELAARMEAVERRLGAVERALGWGNLMMRPVAEAARAAVAPPPLPGVAGDVTGEVPGAVEGVYSAEGTYGGGQARTPGVEPKAGRPGRTWGDLEATIGRNWTSWVGAIVLVIGAFFFIQYAWEQGWLNLSPAARVFSAVGSGIAMGAAGAWTNRRGMRVLAGTLTGAGIAIVMAAFFAGHGRFAPPVFSSRVALAGVCAAAAAGIWRGVRINAVSVAIIALLGAYLAPAILRSGRDESLMLMAYLGALGVVGWSLAYLRPRWPVLRWFVWTCTVLWVGAWLIGYPLRGMHKPLGIGAITFFLAGFIAEAFFTLHRAFRIRDERDESAVPGFTVWLENALGTLSLLTTAAAFGGYYAILRREVGAGGMFHLDPAAAVALGLAAMHGMIALATPSRQFGRSSLLAAAGLVTIAIPLAFGQVAITLAWLILAVALAALGWRRENRAVRAWCVVLLGLALARLFTFDLMDRSLRAVRWHVGEQGVSPWLLLAWGTAVFAHGVGWLFQPPPLKQETTSRGRAGGWGVVIPAVGTIVFFVASAMFWSGPALTLLAIAWVAGLIALVPWGERLGYVGHAALAWAVVAAKWLTADGLEPAMAAWRQPGTSIPVLNGVALSGVLVIALAVWLARRLDAAGRKVIAVAVLLLGFAWLNFETLRLVDYTAARFADFATAKHVAMSVLWGSVGLVAVVVGFARALRPLRYAALGLLGFTLGKILLVDLAQVRPVYRILSFVAVGALLLCVSFVYHRHEAGREVR